MREEKLPGAALKGVYLEGPYLSSPGAMDPAFFENPTLKGIKELTGICPGLIRVVAIAPELPGALRVIEYLASEGITVSAGHFTCSAEKLREAVDCGLSLITHCCSNTEGPLLCERGVYHTDGPLLEILADDRLHVEVICDGVHVDPRLVKTLYRVKGRERFCAVTDGCAASGIRGRFLDFPGPDGSPEHFEVRHHALYIRGTENLCGSMLTMDKAVRNLMLFCGISREEAQYACSTIPAKSAHITI